MRATPTGPGRMPAGKAGPPAGVRVRRRLPSYVPILVLVQIVTWSGELVKPFFAPSGTRGGMGTILVNHRSLMVGQAFQPAQERRQECLRHLTVAAQMLPAVAAGPSCRA